MVAVVRMHGVSEASIVVLESEHSVLKQNHLAGSR